MREIQKLVEAVLGLVIGFMILKSLPKDMFDLAIIPFTLLFIAIIILILNWFDKNFR